MYKRVLLKLSGEALGNPYDVDVLNALAVQIKKIVENGTEVGIVVGGGNIARGRTFTKLGLDSKKSDYIGMQATVMNAQMIEASLIKNGVKAKAMSAYPVNNVLDLDVAKANNLLKKKTVVVFGGGTGKPGFSTDTACALRAADINAEVILMAKSGVDGVYSADPKVDANATRYKEMYFDDIIKNKLGVIDLQAAKICKKNKIMGFVFNMLEKNNIYKATTGKAVGTIIK